MLALIEISGGELEALKLQKLLFLSQVGSQTPVFEFVPYHYGCFSFQAQQDLNTLKKYGLVKEDSDLGTWSTTERTSNLITSADLNRLKMVINQFGSLTSSQLIELTYKRYPYYAFNSKVASKYLNSAELTLVKETVIQSSEKLLFTIGYEGISLETYLNKLIKANVRALADVRRNALSMKYGFSKRQLENACKGVNINYYHIPELGIASSERKDLAGPETYMVLFREYLQTLPYATEGLEQLNKIIANHGRVALTCFEHDHCSCHRGTLAEYYTSIINKTLPLNHL